MPRGSISMLLSATAAALGLSASALASSTNSTLTVLVNFNNASLDGRNPSGSPLIADSLGDLYGTTYQGGTGGGNGTIYEMNGSTDAETVLVNFNTSSGATPYGGVVADASFNLYGTTNAGGADSDGTIYKVAATTNKLTTLLTFNGSNGAHPSTSLTFGPDGNLYGTTNSGGTGGSGTVFDINPTTSAFTTLVNFNVGNGSIPNTQLTADRFGNLYGTTEEGGPAGDGTVYEISAVTHAFSTIASFNGSNGASPYTNVEVDAAGNIFGTTGVGGTGGVGTVFEIPAGTSSIDTLASFNTSTGGTPATNILLDADDDIFGATDTGGETGGEGYGTIFRLDGTTHAISTLAALDYDTSGQYPGGFYASANGTIFGTAQMGGDSLNGTLFQITNAGYAVPEPACASLLCGVVVSALLLRRRRSDSNIARWRLIRGPSDPAVDDR